MLIRWYPTPSTSDNADPQSRKSVTGPVNIVIRHEYHLHKQWEASAADTRTEEQPYRSLQARRDHAAGMQALSMLGRAQILHSKFATRGCQNFCSEACFEFTLLGLFSNSLAGKNSNISQFFSEHFSERSERLGSFRKKSMAACCHLKVYVSLFFSDFFFLRDNLR